MKCWKVPENVSGPVEVTVTENDISYTDTTNIFDIALTAVKLTLTKGESISICISGDGFNKIEKPVPLNITNLTPQNINMAGGDNQEILIQPDDISEDGTFEKEVKITAIKTGGFSVMVNIEPAESEFIKRIPPVGSIYDSPASQPISFEWESFDSTLHTRISKVIPDLTYTIKFWLLSAYIIEKMKEYELIENEVDLKYFYTDPVKNYLTFTKEGIEGTSFSYIKDTYNPFISGLTYVWQVEAYIGDSLIQVNNKVGAFTVAENEDAPKKEPSTIDDTPIKTECNELKTTNLTLEWKDEIKDSDWPVDEILADITQSISIALHPPSCNPKISNYEKKAVNDVFNITPSYKDNDPQDDDIYFSSTQAIYAANCVYILSYTMYGDADFKGAVSKKLLKSIIKEIKFFYAAMFVPAIAPWQKSDSLPNLEFATKYLELIKSLLNNPNLNTIIKKLEKENTGNSNFKWIKAILNLFEVAEMGFSTTIWEICGSYLPCDSCDYSVDNYSISELGDQDHYIKRKWSIGNKSGVHENKGKKY